MDEEKTPVAVTTEKTQSAILTQESTTPESLNGVTPSNKTLIAVGICAYTHRIGNIVRKLPTKHDELFSVPSIRLEAQIYKHLGPHERIIKCLSDREDLVDLEFAPNGHVQDYVKAHPDASDAFRLRIVRESTEAVVFIHSKGVIHSDLAARQFLLDADLHVKLSDFGFSAFEGTAELGFENERHWLPREFSESSSVKSDLFAFGSTIYEIMAGEEPYRDKEEGEIEALYRKGVFPDVDGLLCGNIILGCWHGSFKSAAEILPELSLQHSTPVYNMMTYWFIKARSVFQLLFARASTLFRLHVFREH